MGKFQCRIRRGKSMGLPALFLMAVVFLSLGAAAPEAWAKKHKSEIPFAAAKIIIEFNSTGNDVGVQVSLDGEPWQKLKIESPNGRKILDITASRSLKKQGLTELFFESSEPTLDEVPLAEFLARFPEGEYEFEGVTIEGAKLESKATLTHAIPDGPNVSAQVGPGDSLVISWVAPPTISSLTGLPIDIVAYQVIVDSFQVTVPHTVLSVTVSPEFVASLESGVHNFEVLAIEAGGNQTITEGSFVLP